MDENSQIIWEAPIIEQPEFRLYYDDNGNVITYTCEKLEGNYITVDNMTFAEARPDVKVIDGRLVKLQINSVISKLEPSNTGTLCEVEDISILCEKDGQYWDLKTYVF